MRYYLLLVLIAAGSYAVAATLAACGVAVLWPRCRAARARHVAHTRAHLLAALRLAPAATGLFCASVACGVFLRFEPRNTTEAPALVLWAAATLALVFVAVGLRRVASAVYGSVRCRRLLRDCGRRWDRGAQPPVWIVDTPYPVAAIVGLVRPRVLISSSVLHGCPASEMDAIVRHETAHLRRRDNLIRASMRCLPDPLALTRTGREIHESWAAAAEQAADDEAAGPALPARTELAAALVRVAAMTQGPPPAWMRGVAFYEGTHLEERVRRLLVPGTTHTAVCGPRTVAGILAAAGALLVGVDDIAVQLHAVMEAAVRILP